MLVIEPGNRMKKILILLVISMLVFNGCVSFPDPNLPPQKNINFNEFKKNHISKDKKFFLEIESELFINDNNHLINEERINSQLKKSIYKELNKLNFGVWKEKEEDADFIVLAKTKANLKVNFLYSFISGLTLYILPSRQTSHIEYVFIVTNKKTNTKKQFELSLNSVTWHSIFLLPAKLFRDPSEENFNRFRAIFVEMGQDDIFSS